ncbi:hypothetical protein V5O48_001480 [Marasmius crinis-equi]|uniref:Vacuolar protein sorting-associated protein 62 n=1 Tax=Marasmius crinis-equi TaxID=585013 RepID=A0ABR3FYE5_9AGAR
MLRLGLFVVLALTLVSQAAPTPENVALAKKYAPQFRFHKDEKYFPSTIAYFLSNTDVSDQASFVAHTIQYSTDSGQLVDENGGLVNGNPTVQNVDDAPNQGSGLFLSTPISSSKDGWLRGFDPTTTASETHTFVAPKANGVVDIYYWLFTPFNEAKNVPVVGQVGDHVGDWERLAVRTVNGVATQVDYHAHSDTGSTVPFDQAPKFDNGQRPAAYVAKGSHGIWQTADTHTYVDVVIFKLQDITGDGGVQWDTRDSLVVYNYPDTFSGDQDWLNYKGAYGNKGQTDCWWHFIYDECEVVTGPIGPYRPDVLGASLTAPPETEGVTALDPAKWDMSGPLSQVLGTPSGSVDKSTFTFYLSSDLTSGSDAKFVAIKQTCQAADSAESTTTFATTSFDGKSTKFTASPAACASNGNAALYAVGLCSSDAEESCSFSRTRKLRAFGPNGGVNTTAIEVEDLDLWSTL